MRFSLETQKELPLKLASEDPVVNSGLNAVSLLKRHSLLACNTTPAASLEGSILLFNDYRHASPPAHSESRGVVDVQVDFTGLAIYARIAPHKTGYASVPHRSAEHRPVLIRGGGGASGEFAQQLLKIDNLLRPGWAKPHRP